MAEIGKHIGVKIGKPKVQSRVRRLTSIQLISPDGYDNYFTINQCK